VDAILNVELAVLYFPFRQTTPSNTLIYGARRTFEFRTKRRYIGSLRSPHSPLGPFCDICAATNSYQTDISVIAER
jgi:hypothetical protein